MSINLKTYFNLLRIKDWRGYFLGGLFGFLLAEGFSFPTKDIILFFFVGILFLAFGFSVNDCFDTKEDEYKAEKRQIVKRELSLKKSLVFSISLGLLGLALSAILGLKVFLFSLFSLLIGFFYSAPPLRFKSRPIFDIISHGLFAGALIFIFPLIVFRAEIKLIHYFIIFSIFYFSILAELRNHLEDYETDKKAGLKTTVCALGLKNSENLLKYLAVFSPLVIFPIFLFTSQIYFFSFLIFTLLFLFFFFPEKNYRIMDAYLFLSLGLVLLEKFF